VGLSHVRVTGLMPPTYPEVTVDIEPAVDIAPEAENRTCRICLQDDETPDDHLIAPCLCSGTIKWVHSKCLDEWRAQEQVALAFSHCPQCRFQYRTEIDDSAERTKAIKLTLFLARDSILLFVAVQTAAVLLAMLLKACDPGGFVPSLYPQGWADSTAGVKLSIGPYYVSSCVLLLALLGVLGVGLYLTGNLSPDAWRSEARHVPRWRQPRGDSCCRCSDCPGDCGDTCFYWYICNDGGRGCHCPNCNCNCDAVNCDGCKCDGEAGAILLVVGLALIVVFAFIGIFVGIFLTSILFQRLVQRHVNLLRMREETRVHRVLDLSGRPELRASFCSTPAAGYGYVAPILAEESSLEAPNRPLVMAGRDAGSNSGSRSSDPPPKAAKGQCA